MHVCDRHWDHKNEIANSFLTTSHMWLASHSPFAINHSLTISFWPSPRFLFHSLFSLSVYLCLVGSLCIGVYWCSKETGGKTEHWMKEGQRNTQRHLLCSETQRADLKISVLKKTWLIFLHTDVIQYLVLATSQHTRLKLPALLISFYFSWIERNIP